MSADWKTLKPFAAVHALGALDGEELELVRTELQSLSDPEKAEYRAFVRVGQLFALSPAQTPPPPDLKRKILERIQGEKPRPSGLEIRRKPAGPAERLAASMGISTLKLMQIVCAALIGVAVLSSWWAWRGYRGGLRAGDELRSLTRELQSTQDSLADMRGKAALLGVSQLQVVMLRQAGMQEAWGAVFWDPATGAALLQTRGLKAGKDYALWVMTDGHALPALRFRAASAEGLRRLAKLPEADRRRITAFVITEEKEADVSQPSDARWLEGSPLL